MKWQIIVYYYLVRGQRCGRIKNVFQNAMFKCFSVSYRFWLLQVLNCFNFWLNSFVRLSVTLYFPMSVCLSHSAFVGIVSVLLISDSVSPFLLVVTHFISKLYHTFCIIQPISFWRERKCSAFVSKFKFFKMLTD